MILASDPPQQKIFDQHSDRSDQEWREKKRDPIVDAQGVKQDDCKHGAEHVHGAMGKIDDLEQAENDRQPQTQKRVKRAVNDPDQKLTSEHSKGNIENHGHVAHSRGSAMVIPGISLLRVPGTALPDGRAVRG